MTGTAHPEQSIRDTPDGAAISADAPLLLRSANDGKAAAVLHGVGLRFAAELQKHLRQMGAAKCTVAAKPVELVTSLGWEETSGDHLMWQFANNGRASTMALAMTPTQLRQLVDIFYGGTGAQVQSAKALSFAEDRFANRYGDELAKLLAFAWRDATQSASALSAKFVIGRNPLTDADSGVLIQPLTLAGSPFASATILLACHADCVSDGNTAGQADAAPSLPPIDRRWLEALHASLGNVTLPVSATLARPEISVGRMLTLSVGDIIPLQLPRQLPVLVAGRALASGTLGEVGGRIAINIETLRQRTL